MKTLEELKVFLGRKPKQVEKIMFETYVENSLFGFDKDKDGNLRVVHTVVLKEREMFNNYLFSMKRYMEEGYYDIIEQQVKYPGIKGILLALTQDVEGYTLRYQYNDPVTNTLISDKITVQ